MTNKPLLARRIENNFTVAVCTAVVITWSAAWALFGYTDLALFGLIISCILAVVNIICALLVERTITLVQQGPKHYIVIPDDDGDIVEF